VTYLAALATTVKVGGFLYIMEAVVSLACDGATTDSEGLDRVQLYSQRSAAGCSARGGVSSHASSAWFINVHLEHSGESARKTLEVDQRCCRWLRPDVVSSEIVATLG